MNPINAANSIQAKTDAIAIPPRKCPTVATAKPNNSTRGLRQLDINEEAKNEKRDGPIKYNF